MIKKTINIKAHELGGIPASAVTYHINIPIEQRMDDMGVFSDVETIPYDGYNMVDYSPLDDKMSLSGWTSTYISVGRTVFEQGYAIERARWVNLTANDVYIAGGDSVTGFTDSKAYDVRSYKLGEPYIVGLSLGTGVYEDMDGVTISGVSKVVSLTDGLSYVIDAPDDNDAGTPMQRRGLWYVDMTGSTRNPVVNGERVAIPTTVVSFRPEGLNRTNSSFKAVVKDEYLFGVAGKPEISNDLFIDRGATSVLEPHLRLSEISSLDHLIRYGNGYYKINRI